MAMDESTPELELPGFRFHPTEEELLNYYLKTMVFGNKLRANIIGFLNIYKHDPRELPGLAKIGEREWYFFVPRDRKHGSGGRPNRTTENGFWKATGSDRKIFSVSEPKKMLLGLRKTLVFYEGRAPRGRKTDWIMNEYRLPDTTSSQPKQDIVLCKIYRKATSLKVLEQRAAMEEVIKTASAYNMPSPVTPSMDSFSLSDQIEEANVTQSDGNIVEFKKENEETIPIDDKMVEGSCKERSSNGLMLPDEIGSLADLQVPKLNMDWTQDSFWTQLRSPWLDNVRYFLSMC